MEPSAITQALGLTHWKAAAAVKPMGLAASALLSAGEAGWLRKIFQAR